MKIYDITATLCDTRPFYNDNDKIVITRPMQIANGDICNVSRITITGHMGTHADMPLHFVDGGTACHDTDITHFFGAAKVFHLPLGRDITREDLLPMDIAAGDIILLGTGQSKYMHQGPMKKDFTVITPDAAAFLSERKIKTLGIDYLSVDAYSSPDFPVHKILLGSGIAILEGLVLDDVPAGEYEISALPLKLKGGDGSPVRAILVKR